MGDWVGHRHNRLKPENAVLVTAHDTPTIRAVVVSMLDVIMACGVSLPDIDLATLDRLPGGVFESADDETWFAFGVGGDGGSIGEVLGFVGVKWTEDGAFGAVGWFGVVN